jgi:hypothetical protein
MACIHDRAQVPPDITLRDATRWEHGAMSGQRAELWVNAQLVDTVEPGFGVHRLSDSSLVFLAVRSFDTVLDIAGPTTPVLRTAG